MVISSLVTRWVTASSQHRCQNDSSQKIFLCFTWVETSIDTCCKTTFLLFQRRMQWFACSLSKSNWTPEINSIGWAAHPALDVLLTAELRHYCPSRSSKPSHRMTSSKSEVTMVRPEWARGKREERRRDEERGWEGWMGAEGLGWWVRERRTAVTVSIHQGAQGWHGSRQKRKNKRRRGG